MWYKIKHRILSNKRWISILFSFIVLLLGKLSSFGIPDNVFWILIGILVFVSEDFLLWLIFMKTALPKEIDLERDSLFFNSLSLTIPREIEDLEDIIGNGNKKTILVKYYKPLFDALIQIISMHLSRYNRDIKNNSSSYSLDKLITDLINNTNSTRKKLLKQLDIDEDDIIISLDRHFKMMLNNIIGDIKRINNSNLYQNHFSAIKVVIDAVLTAMCEKYFSRKALKEIIELHVSTNNYNKLKE